MQHDFTTEVVADGDATVIYARGEIDLASVAHLRDAIEQHLGPHQSIILDLAEVQFMDSHCLRFLVQARGTLTADGGSLVLRNPSEAARRVLTSAQVERYLLIEENRRQSP